MTEQLIFWMRAYVAGSALSGTIVYWLLPHIARRLLNRLISSVGEVFQKELNKHRQTILERGRETALAAPQLRLVGSLVQPHVEKLIGWLSEKLAFPAETFARKPAVEACMKRIEAKRGTAAFAVSQVVMLFVFLGFLLGRWCIHD